MSINRVVLTGRLTKDVELRSTASGLSVVSFTVAVDNNMSKDQQTATASFISCVAWNNQAKFLEQYCKKGNLVALEGRLQQRSYDGKNGKVYVTEVVCDRVENLSPRDPSQASNTNNQGFSIDENSGNGNDLPYSDDDLPF